MKLPKINQSKINLKLFFSISFSLGLFWLGFFLYRLLLRFPYTRDMLPINKYLFLSVIVFALFLNILSLNEQLFKITILTYLSNKVIFLLHLLYWKPLYQLFLYLIDRIPNSGKFLKSIARLATKHMYRPWFQYSLKISYILFIILPRITLAFLFFLNVYVYYTFTKFLLLIPFIILSLILSKFIIFLFYNFCIYNIDILSNLVDVREEKTGMVFSLKTHLNSKKHHLSVHADNYYLLLEFYKVVNAFKQGLNLNIESFIQIPLQLMYSIGLIKLICIFSNIYIIDEIYLLLLYYFIILWLFIKEEKKLYEQGQKEREKSQKTLYDKIKTFSINCWYYRGPIALVLLNVIITIIILCYEDKWIC